MTTYATIEVLPVTAVIGAEVRGADLTRPLSERQRDEVRQALLRHHVLFFRDSELTEAEQFAFATQFAPPMLAGPGGNAGAMGAMGAPDAPAGAARAPAPSPFVTLRDTPESPPKADHWHSDVPFAKEPPDFAVLCMLATPEVGGDTLWVNMHAVYDRLSPTMQEVLAGLDLMVGIGAPVKVGYAGREGGEEAYQRMLAETPPARHPLVRIHPETGRPSLSYAGSEFTRGIAGMHPGESEAILAYLRTRLDDPNCQVRWRWRQHDVAMWDERCTDHRAMSDHYPAFRSIRRCLVGQGAPVGPRASAGV